MKEFEALGKQVTASRNLEWFPLLGEGHLLDGKTTLEVTLLCSEFTCRCPVTNQPDWAKVHIDYGTKERIVESKSVKLYLETFRNEPVFHEHLAMQILRDFVEVLRPRWCNVKVIFNTRGGIAITAKASYTGPLTTYPNWYTKVSPKKETYTYMEVGNPDPIEVPTGQVEHAAPASDSVEDAPFTQPRWW